MFLNLKPSTDLIFSLQAGGTVEIILIMALKKNQDSEMVYIRERTQNVLYLQFSPLENTVH